MCDVKEFLEKLNKIKILKYKGIMKQVLLHSNDSYLFPLPQTYLSLVKEISNKTNLFENNINIYHKGKFVTENNFRE